MSAFIVSEKHINTLVTWASKNGIVCKGCPVKGHEQGFATMLYRQNVRSVNYRYNEDTPFYGIRYEPTKVEAIKENLQIVKACNCYDYQACETDNYDKTLAALLVEKIRHFAARLDGLTEIEAYALVRQHPELEWVID